jgi:two-component system, NarL family, nitrate/nitrite response regulator NarL
LIGACGLVALAAWSHADAQTIARAGDPSCAPILEAMKKQLALPVFGAALALSEKTVKAHITAIFKALNVANRTQAAAAGREQGIIS